MNARIVVLVLAASLWLGLAVGIVWAATQSSVSDGLRHVAADRWGIVTLVDIYAGVFVVAVWIWLHERRPVVWLAWVVGLVGLGHLVSLTYLLQRLARTRSLFAAIAPAPRSDSPRRPERRAGAE